MKIDTSKLRKAQILLDMIVEELEYNTDEQTAYVETYQNGRENGFSICGGFGKNSVTFSESRGSDQIVVYPNNTANQGLSDEAYKAARYFRYDAYKEACLYCVKHLTKKVK